MNMATTYGNATDVLADVYDQSVGKNGSNSFYAIQSRGGWLLVLL